MGLPLLGCAVDEIEDVHVILGIDSDALITLGISLIQGLFELVSWVRLHQSPVLHKFDGALIRQVGRPSLWPIVDDCQLDGRAVGISHSYGAIDWIEVSWDPAFTTLELISVIMIDGSLLHFETV